MCNTIQASKNESPAVPRWEIGVTVTALFILAGAVVPLMRIDDSDAAVLDGDPFSQGLHALVYGAAFVLLLGRRIGRGLFARVPMSLWALVALVLVSVCWSDDPALTARRGGALVGTTVVGLYFGIRYTLEEQLRLIVAVLTLAAVLSVFFALSTSLGIMEGTHDGAWRGVFIHKNGLGRMMVLLAVASLTQLLAGRLRSPLYWTCFGVATVLVVLSESRTALAVYLGALAVFPVLRTVRIRYTLAVPVVLATLTSVFVGVLWAMNELDAISLAIGRDMTLTGRTVLWQSALEMMLERPWFGYGYAAFWRGWDGPSASVWAATLWQPPHAHNGLLDLGLDLGLLGVGLFVWVFVVTGAKAFQRARASDGIGGYWPLLFLCFFVMGNATETALLRQDNLLWVLFVAILVGLPVHERPTSALESRGSVSWRWRRGVIVPGRSLNPAAPMPAPTS